MKATLLILLLVFTVPMFGQGIIPSRAEADSARMRVNMKADSLGEDATATIGDLLDMATALKQYVHETAVTMPAYAKNGVAAQTKAKTDSLDRYYSQLGVDFNQYQAVMQVNLKAEFNDIYGNLDDHAAKIQQHDELELARADDEDDLADETLERIRAKYRQKLLAQEPTVAPTEVIKATERPEPESEKARRLRRIRLNAPWR